MGMTAINPHIFRQYDIRGLVGQDLTPEVVELIGKAFGSRLRGKGGKLIVIGHDVRNSSPVFAEAIGQGLASTGLEVINVGCVATPVLYFSIFHFKGDGGIMITGSHNPVTYNGLKICEGPWPIYGEDILSLYHDLQRGGIGGSSGKGTRGRVRQENVLPVYTEQLGKRFDQNLGAKVVVDAGNGNAGPIFPPLLRRLGCQVEELYCEPDGNFPNHLPDPEDPKNVKDLIWRVKETKADAGLAFDGDSDRVGVIDDLGGKINSDRLVLLFAKHYLARHPGGKIVYDVKCSEILEEEIRKAGGIPIMWQTGHSLVKKKMREENALLAGELSGHICVYKDYYGFDDAFFAALLTLQIRKSTGQSISQLFAGFPKTCATHEIKVGCPDERKFAVVSEVLKDVKASGGKVIDIDGARILYPEGWALVRASNTTPCLTLRFESRRQENLEQVMIKTERMLKKFKDLDCRQLHETIEEVRAPLH